MKFVVLHLIRRTPQQVIAPWHRQFIYLYAPSTLIPPIDRCLAELMPICFTVVTHNSAHATISGNMRSPIIHQSSLSARAHSASGRIRAPAAGMGKNQSVIGNPKVTLSFSLLPSVPGWVVAGCWFSAGRRCGIKQIKCAVIGSEAANR